jgi:hypothetical protein
MVGDHDTVCSTLHGQTNIFRIKDTFEHEFSALYFLNPFTIVPSKAGIKLLLRLGSKRTDIVDTFGMTDDISKASAMCFQHTHAPRRLTHHIDQVAQAHAVKRFSVSL